MSTSSQTPGLGRQPEPITTLEGAAGFLSERGLPKAAAALRQMAQGSPQPTPLSPERLAEAKSLLRYESSISFHSARAKATMLLLVAEAERLTTELDRTRAEIRAERDAEIIAWLGKKAREYRSTGSRQHALQANAVDAMASKIARGAVRSDNVAGVVTRAGVLREIVTRLGSRATLYGDSRTVNEVMCDLDRLAVEAGDVGERKSAQPAEQPAPRTERSYWQAITDALNAAVNAGMPVGIDLDGTLTDHRVWSVVWDRQAGQWAVAGYDDEDESTQCPAARPGDLSPCEGPSDAVRIVDHRTTSAEALANTELGTHGCVHHGARLLVNTGGGRVYPGPSDTTGRKPGQSAAVETYLRVNGGTS